MGTKFILWLCFLILSLGGCAPTNSGDAQKAVADYDVVFNQNLSLKSASGVSGTGKLQFKNPLLGINSNEHYLLAFRPLSSTSKLTLHSHFSGFFLEDGLKAEFFPQKGKLYLRLSTPGYPFTKAQELFDLDGMKEVRLEVEVHDGEGGGVRVLVWNDLISYQGETVHRQERLYPGNADFDSQAQGLIFLSSGHGMLWGLELNDVDLTAAKRQAPYVE